MRNERQNAIINLIKAENIYTQSQLVKRLRESGHQVTQATISRDIRELGLIKSTYDDGRYIAADSIKIKISNKLLTFIREATISVVLADNLVVVKTLSSSAGAVGSAIDQMELPELIGSIGGVDTILLITPTYKDAMRLKSKLESVIKQC